LKHLKTQAAVLTAVLVLSFFAGTTLTAASDGEKGDETKTETAIAEGADWLVARQSENGGWTPFSVSKNNALAVRAFAATGNTSSPKYVLLLSKLKDLLHHFPVHEPECPAGVGGDLRVVRHHNDCLSTLVRGFQEFHNVLARL